MSIADSISDLGSRISGENGQEEEISTDEEKLEEEIREVLDREETVKEKLSYDKEKSMNYYPQAINHSREILEELEDSEQKAEEIEKLVEDVEQRISRDENDIESDIQEIDSPIKGLEKVEKRLKGLFSQLEEDIRSKELTVQEVTNEIPRILEKQREIIQDLIRNDEVFQKNQKDIYPVLGYIYRLKDIIKDEEQEIKRLEQELNEFKDIFEHLETAEQHSVQLIKKEKSMQKIKNSESVKHTREAIEKGKEDSVNVYSSKESARIVDEEASEIRVLEERTGKVSEKANKTAEKIKDLKNRDRNFTRKFEEIRSRLESVDAVLENEIAEAKRLEKMFLSGRKELEKSLEEENISREKLDRYLELYRAIHDEGRREKLNEVFNGQDGILPLMKVMKDAVEKGLEETMKDSQ